MTRVFSNQLSVFLIIFICACIIPAFAYAEGFVSLVGLPGLDQAADGDSQDLINSLYRIAIIAAALLAVIKLILAGAKYVLSGIVTEKESAKKDIQAALIGLLIIIAAVTILRTINPDIAKLPALSAINVAEYIPPPSSDLADIGVGTRVRSCQGKDAETCASDICDGMNGTVTEDGVRYESGSVTHAGKPVCVYSVPTSNDAQTGDGEPAEPRPGDVTIVEGLTYNENIEYDISRIEEFIKKARELDIYISNDKVSNDPANNVTAIRTCEEVSGGKAYIIQGELLSGDMLLCVKK